MEKMISVCGLICTDCPAYLATQNDDDEGRKKVANEWSSDKLLLKPEDINCDGCSAIEKRLIKFCTMCEVRDCGLERKLQNCAHCDEYPCEKLNKHLETIGEWGVKAKVNLDEIRKNI